MSADPHAAAAGRRASGRRVAGIPPLLVVAFVMFTTTLASNAPSPLYVVYQERFGFSPATLTYIFSAYALGVMVALVLVGRLSDQIGRRRVIVPAMALLALSAALFAGAAGTVWLLAARGVQGLATGTLTAAATAALVELEPHRDRKRASYINTVMFIGGAAIGPLLFGFLVQYAPLPRVLPFLVELALVSIGLALMVLVPETVERGPVFRWRLQRPSVPSPIRPAFAAASLTLAVSWGVGALYASLSPSIDRQLLHVQSHAAAGAVLFAFYGLGGVAQVLLRRWPSRITMVTGVGGLAAGMALVGWGLINSTVALFLAGTVLAGAGGGLAFMGSLALLNEVAPPQRRAEVVSAYNVVGYVALSAPVIGVGLIAGVAGLQTATEVFTAAAVAVSVVAIVLTVLLPSDPLARLSDDELVELGLDPSAIASGLG